MVAALALSAVAVAVSGGPALAVPGTLKISSLKARSVVTRTGAVPVLAQTPPPPPRHYHPPTKKGLPHTGPAIPAPVGTTVGVALTLMGVTGLGWLRRARARPAG
jgi:hypothetical protein